MRIKTASAALVAALALVGGTACNNGPDPVDEAPTPTPPGGVVPNGEEGDEGENERAPSGFNEPGASGSFECDGQDITINSDDADLHLRGSCGTVVTNGERAQLVIDDATMIVVNGEDSEVTYGGEPEIIVNAENATVEAG